jgi:hypothetical protein
MFAAAAVALGVLVLVSPRIEVTPAR